LLDQAAAFGWDAVLYELLKTARALFSTPIPEDVGLGGGYQISSPITKTVTEKGEPARTRLQAELKKINS